MKKTSKEYAEKLAKEIYPMEKLHASERQLAYYKGYLKAISENNVEELIDALNLALPELTPIMRHIALKAIKPHDND